MQILPPDSPPDIKPVPYAQRTIDALGLTPGQMVVFQEAGLYTLGQYDAFLAAGRSPLSFKGVGPVAMVKIAEAHESQRSRLEFEKYRIAPKLKVGR
jgi:hypothetical protein